MSIKIIEQIKQAAENVEKEGTAFFEKENNSAGTRTRKVAQEMKVLLQQLRDSVTETRNSK